MNRKGLILISIPVGIVLFVLALYSTGAGHGSYWAVILFYPLPSLAAYLLYSIADRGWTQSLQLVIWAALCLPWYPMLAALLTSAKRGARKFAIVLLVVHGIMAAAMILFG